MKTLPGGAKGNGQYFPMIKTLAAMCRAMEYLVIQSVTSFESNLKDLQANGSKKLVNSSEFKKIVSEVAAIRGREGYVGHPKMERLRTMCIEHFEAAKDEVDEYTGEKRETRVMIFCNFRAVVEEIVDCLNTQRPLIKATPFVGQASSKGTKGKSQKEQLEVRFIFSFRFHARSSSNSSPLVRVARLFASSRKEFTTFSLQLRSEKKGWISERFVGLNRVDFVM